MEGKVDQPYSFAIRGTVVSVFHSSGDYEKKKTQIVVYFFTPNLSHIKEQMHRVLCLDHLVNLQSALGKSEN